MIFVWNLISVMFAMAMVLVASYFPDSWLVKAFFSTFGIKVQSSYDFFKWGFPLVSFGGMALLAISAVFIRKRNKSNFDMSVAGENIIGLGIFSLICGIVLMGSIAIDSKINKDIIPYASIAVEAVLSSGFGILLCTILRSIEMVKYGDTSESEGGAIASKMDWTAISEFGLAIRSVTDSFKSLPETVKKVEASLDSAAESADKFSTDIAAITRSVKETKVFVEETKAFVEKTKELTDAMNTNIKEANVSISAMKVAAEETGKTIEENNKAVKALNTLIGQISTLIASFDKFIKRA